MVIAPAVFLPEFFYFKKPHNKYFLPILRKANSILVQDEASKMLLAENDVESEVCGDSRFDRVLQNAETPFEDELLARFTASGNTMIGGSTWSKDEELLADALSRNPELKLIVAPHNIAPENIDRVEKLFSRFGVFRYSHKPDTTDKYRVCIIDNIGLLSRLYRYGQLAFIGGAFGKGIHNSLEAAAYGLSLFFGPNHKAFIEPALMLNEGFAFEVHSEQDFSKTLSPLLQNPEKLQQLQTQASDFVKANSGSVVKIMKHVTSLLPSNAH